jgi:hypothetical protein
VLPTHGKAAGGDSITIVGKDIDPLASVDFRLHPSDTLIPAAAITGFIDFPDNIQHITVTTPPIPEHSGVAGDITFFDRSVTLRVTNPGPDFDELELGYTVKFIDRTPTFVEIGDVLFFPERLTVPTGGGTLFESFTAGSDLWVQTYEFIPDGAGEVDYKAFGEFDFRPADPRFNQRRGNFRRPRNFTPFITRGQIMKVQLETFPGFAAGWTVEIEDDLGVDVLQGAGAAAGPAPGTIAEFVPVLVDVNGESQPVVLHDHLRFHVTGAAAGTPPATYGQVKVWYGLD